MKIICFALVLAVFTAAPAFCGGLTEENMVNKQEIELENINNVTIAYSWENIAVMESDTDKLILKEYMSIDKSDYYALINRSENTVSVKKGKRPFGLGTGILFNKYNARVEVYLPASYKKSVSVKTASGNIKMAGNYECSEISLECSSGNITIENISAENVNVSASSGNIQGGTLNGNAAIEVSSGNIKFDSVNGNAAIKANSGNINFDSINGNATIKVSSGSIKCDSVNGDISAESSSGSVNCGVTEKAREVSLVTSSGEASLYLPKNYAFNFRSKTSSGSLSTPFSDKLFSPVSDRRTTEGTIGANSENKPGNNVSVQTSSGSIRVRWIE